jgi:hypothetical protein
MVNEKIRKKNIKFPLQYIFRVYCNEDQVHTKLEVQRLGERRFQRIYPNRTHLFEFGYSSCREETIWQDFLCLQFDEPTQTSQGVR